MLDQIEISEQIFLKATTIISQSLCLRGRLNEILFD